MAQLCLCIKMLQDAHSYLANPTPLQKERPIMLQKLHKDFFCKEKTGNYLLSSEVNIRLLLQTQGKLTARNGRELNQKSLLPESQPVQALQLLWISLWSNWQHVPSCELPSATEVWCSLQAVCTGVGQVLTKWEQTPLQPPHTAVLNTTAALKSLAGAAPAPADKISRKNKLSWVCHNNLQYTY